MSYYSTQIMTKTHKIIDDYINIQEKTSVPETQDIKLGSNEGFTVDATYVYCDLVDSTKLAQRLKKPAAAKIVRSYINPASDILRHYGGEIRSFDGDRVMAIFMGDGKETSAVRAALAVNWLVQEIVAPKIQAEWSDVAQIWTAKHCVGVDTGEALITRGGVRGDNDLISIGSAPNVAAKLSDLRNSFSIHITEAVYAAMSNDVAFTNDTGVAMWHVTQMFMPIGTRQFKIFSSNYWWEP